LIGLLAAALVSAAGPEVTPERRDAAVFAVTHGLVVANVVRNCRRHEARLGGDLEGALSAWRERNAERAAAAEGYLEYVRSVIERQRGPLAAQDFNAKTRGLSRRKANEALNDIFERATPQEWTCRTWLEAISAGQADLDHEPKYLPVLDELVEFEKKVRRGEIR
jgi:uncharacterized membrane protein YccC